MALRERSSFTYHKALVFIFTYYIALHRWKNRHKSVNLKYRLSTYTDLYQDKIVCHFSFVPSNIIGNSISRRKVSTVYITLTWTYITHMWTEIQCSSLTTFYVSSTVQVIDCSGTVY